MKLYSGCQVRVGMFMSAFVVVINASDCKLNTEREKVTSARCCYLGGKLLAQLVGGQTVLGEAVVKVLEY